MHGMRAAELDKQFGGFVFSDDLSYQKTNHAKIYFPFTKRNELKLITKVIIFLKEL